MTHTIPVLAQTTIVTPALRRDRELPFGTGRAMLGVNAGLESSLEDGSA